MSKLTVEEQLRWEAKLRVELLKIVVAKKTFYLLAAMRLYIEKELLLAATKELSDYDRETIKSMVLELNKHQHKVDHDNEKVIADDGFIFSEPQPLIRKKTDKFGEEKISTIGSRYLNNNERVAIEDSVIFLKDDKAKEEVGIITYWLCGKHGGFCGVENESGDSFLLTKDQIIRRY
jgi:hypothetical protein